MGRKSKEKNLQNNKNLIINNKNSYTFKHSESNRVSKGKELKNKIYLYFNSLQTEYNYFSKFKEKLDKSKFIELSLQLNKPSKGGISPKELLDYTLEKNLSEDIKKWIIFDKDEYSINDVCNVAENNDIEVGFSNPCFELWFLNHFKYTTAFLNQRGCQKELENILRKECNVKYKKNIDMYDLLYHRINEGIKNSRNQYREKLDLSKDKMNPTTSIYKLVERLNEALQKMEE